MVVRSTMNDICTVVSTGTTVKVFADDAKLYSVLHDTLTSHCLQSCLTAISGLTTVSLNCHRLNA